MWPFAKKQSAPDEDAAPASEPEPEAPPEDRKFNVGKLFIFLILDDGEKVDFVCTGRASLFADGKPYVVSATERMNEVLVGAQKTGFFGIRGRVTEDCIEYVPVARVRFIRATRSDCFKSAQDKAE